MPRTALRRLVLAGLVALLALATTLTMTPAEARVSPTVEKPSIVLVHGAWADASSWKKVTQRLQKRGYTVYAPPNPLRGLHEDAASIAAFVSSIPGPVVLVGHSYGGAVITNAASSTPNVQALVFVDAFIPAATENVLALTAAQPGSMLVGDPNAIFDFRPYPGAPAGDVDLYVKQSLFPTAFANDLPAKTGLALAAGQRPLSFLGAQEPSGPPAWATIPSWALIGTLDNVIPPAEQRIMAARAGAHTVEVAASHLSMLSQSGAVAKLIQQAARAAS
jgi:pimeloyl-ACP methyl ester carboxylesterase